MSHLDPGVDRGVEPDLEHGDGLDPVDVEPIDLDLIERDLRDVETTLARLADGTYFADQPVASVPGTNATGSTTAPAVAPGLEP